MINIKQINYNVTSASRTIKYIVIHDTGNKHSGANAEMHYRYFNSGNRNASADFFIDSTQILQVNNYYSRYTWHCGDGRGRYGITNRNSIGIEMCINSDGNYNTMLNKTVWLTKHLMAKLNIPASRVVRHYDASRKWCPATMGANSWQRWYAFKRLINGGYYDGGGNDSNEWSVKTIQVKLNQCYPYNLAEDGIMGEKTRSAIKHFQKKYNLVVDGIVGVKTKSKINDVIAQIKKGNVTDDRNETWSVKKIQVKLNQCYPYNLVEDGIMGSKTRSAIKHFQKKYGLVVDGIVGIKTKSKINDVIRKIKNG